MYFYIHQKTMSGRKVILCVDDERIVLNSLKKQFKKRFGNDYIIETVENAEEGLELIDELKKEGKEILLIVSDWLMPGMKGDEFLADVHSKFPDIVKVLLTGQADEQAVEVAKSKSIIHAVLHKPWSEDVLIDTVKSGLEDKL